MDDNNPRRRPTDPPMHHPTSNPNYAASLQDPASRSRASFAVPAPPSDRFRPPPALHTSAPASGARDMASTAAYSGYYSQDSTGAASTSTFATSMQQSPLSYQADYTQQDTARQTQQTFGTYNPSLMYGVPQPSPSTSQQSAFDAGAQPQFPTPRQPASALHMLSSDMTTAPYFTSDSGGPQAAPPSLPSQASASAAGPSSLYQQEPSLSGYHASISGMAGLASAADPGAMQADGGGLLKDDQAFAAEAAAGLDKAYSDYKAMVRQVFTHIKAGRLVNAADTLLKISDWLLSKVADLGLTADDARLYPERMKLWADFNHAWLALFQKQKDIVEAGQLQPAQNILHAQLISNMGNELVRLCDGIERHGLVDYQYGVWEEQIIKILLESFDVTEALEKSTASEAGTSSQPGTGVGHG